MKVSSAGFWPGNGGYGKAAFYCYAYPEPEGFAQASVEGRELRQRRWANSCCLTTTWRSPPRRTKRC